MNTKHRHAEATIIRTADLTDLPIINHPGSTAGKKLQVHAITVEYEYRHNENDDQWYFLRQSVTVHGTVLKKDGTPSKVTYNGRLHDYNGSTDMFGITNPDFREEVAALRPDTNLHITTPA